MATVLFECNVTEFSVYPPEDNDVNVFSITEKSLGIKLMNEEEVMVQTEIEKEDAIKLAKLIFFTYGL